MFENFSKLVNERQACRNYIDKKVEQEKLDKIMELALFSPSACNSQPWKLCLVSTEEKVNAVRETLQTEEHNKFLDNVSTFIAVIEQNAVLRKDVDDKFDNNRFVKYDVGELIAYLTLSAKAVGLDTCVIGWMEEERLAKILELESNEQCKLVVAVGYSNDPLRKKIRKPKEEKIKII